MSSCAEAGELITHHVTLNAICMPPPAVGTVMGFDYGLKRIGVAVGDTALGIAHPLATIKYSDKHHRDVTIAALVKEWMPVLAIVGLPTHLNGMEHELSRSVRKFAAHLTTHFKLPVEFVDEFLTSAAANSALQETGVPMHQRKPLLDKVAAQQILQAYFNTNKAHQR